MTEVQIDCELPDGFLEAALRADAISGLTATPKTLPPKWFYDERGSEVFDKITRLEEYYPTRAEREILAASAPAIAAPRAACVSPTTLGTVTLAALCDTSMETALPVTTTALNDANLQPTPELADEKVDPA